MEQPNFTQTDKDFNIYIYIKYKELYGVESDNISLTALLCEFIKEGCSVGFEVIQYL